MKRCVHQQRRDKIMRLFALTVNCSFYYPVVSDVPEIPANYWISLTVSSGRRTIANTHCVYKDYLSLSELKRLEARIGAYLRGRKWQCHPLLARIQKQLAGVMR